MRPIGSLTLPLPRFFPLSGIVLLLPALMVNAALGLASANKAAHL